MAIARRVLPNQMVRLKKPDLVFGTETRWKVTSRFEIRLSARQRVKCVRVSSLVGTVLHLSEREFHRLFRPE